MEREMGEAVRRPQSPVPARRGGVYRRGRRLTVGRTPHPIARVSPLTPGKVRVKGEWAGSSN